MWISKLYKRLPTAEEVRNNRFLKPFARYLHHHFLWQFNRRAVAGGVAVGLFFGIVIPFLQIFFSAFAAILLRVNLPAAALSTLVSNPITFPAIYYFAYRLGDVLTGYTPVPQDEEIEAEIEHAIAVQQGEIEGWLPNLIDWLYGVGMPLAVGLITLATTAALLSYFMISMLWKLRVRQRWQQRRARRALKK